MSFSVVIPFTPESREPALALADVMRSSGSDVVLSGPDTVHVEGARSLNITGGPGRALREGLQAAKKPITVVLDPRVRITRDDAQRVAEPVAQDQADAVFGAHAVSATTIADKTLTSLAGRVTDVRLATPFPAVRAFKTDALRKLSLRADDEAIDAEILVKLSAQFFRIREVPIAGDAPPQSLQDQLTRARTLVRYLGFANDTDNEHEGYNTLARMETAPNYNAWLGRKFRPYLGKRVLEIGAGIGTITQQIQEGRELLIALEMDPFYVDRLQNLFRDKPHVRPYLSGVERADWERLATENLDSVILSNVLEHIEDDAEAIRNFRLVLKPGGKIVIFVPALQSLYGSMDEAVGHFRRYDKTRLHRVLSENGFAVETLDWMNLVGIPGWLMNSVIMKRRTMPPLQLRMFDLVAPAIAAVESKVKLPIGLGLFAVGRAV